MSNLRKACDKCQQKWLGALPNETIEHVHTASQLPREDVDTARGYVVLVSSVSGEWATAQFFNGLPPAYAFARAYTMISLTQFDVEIRPAAAVGALDTRTGETTLLVAPESQPLYAEDEQALLQDWVDGTSLRSRFWLRLQADRERVR